MRALTVLYDGDCGLCALAKRVLAAEPAYLALEFVEARSPAAAARFPGVVPPDAPLELTVIDDAGGIYDGEDAYLMVLYALERYRALALRLAVPALKPLARRLFAALAAGRGAVSGLLGLRSDRAVAAAIDAAADGLVVDPGACDRTQVAARARLLRGDDPVRRAGATGQHRPTQRPAPSERRAPEDEPFWTGG